MSNAQVVFIEGPVDAEIKLFIKRLYEYFTAEGEYTKIVSPERYESMPSRKREHARKFAYSSDKRSKKEIEYWKLLKRHGLPFAYRALDMSFGSPESRVFLESITEESKASNPNFAAELLQVHFDYHNVIEDMRDNHELIVCDRSPMSYFVDVIKGMNKPEIKAGFEMFMNKIGSYNYPVWILQSTPEKQQQRYKEATGITKPIEYFEQLQQFYHDAANSGIWTEVSFIDVNSDDPDDYRAIFASLAFQVNG